MDPDAVQQLLDAQQKLARELKVGWCRLTLSNPP